MCRRRTARWPVVAARVDRLPGKFRQLLRRARSLPQGKKAELLDPGNSHPASRDRGGEGLDPAVGQGSAQDVRIQPRAGRRGFDDARGRLGGRNDLGVDQDHQCAKQLLLPDTTRRHSADQLIETPRPERSFAESIEDVPERRHAKSKLGDGRRNTSRACHRRGNAQDELEIECGAGKGLSLQGFVPLDVDVVPDMSGSQKVPGRLAKPGVVDGSQQLQRFGAEIQLVELVQRSGAADELQPCCLQLGCRIGE